MISLTRKSSFVFLFLFNLPNLCFGQNSASNSINLPVINFYNEHKDINIGKSVMYLKDEKNVYTIDDVIESESFVKSESNVLEMGISDASIWLKFSIRNLSENTQLVIDLAFPTVDEADLYIPEEGKYKVIKVGEYKKFEDRPIQDPNYLFPINIDKGEMKTYYLRVKCREQLFIPLQLGTYENVMNAKKNRDYLSGIYAGIIIVMMLYNLFIFFSVRDRVYIYYVLYILSVGLIQIGFQGYTYQYLYPDIPTLAQTSIFIFSAMSGFFSIIFAWNFLKLDQHIKNAKWFIYACTFLYIISIILCLNGNYVMSYSIIPFVAGSIGITLMYFGFNVLRRGYKPAKYFVIAWFIFLTGIIIFALANLGFLPYNDFTRYTMQVGSGIEVVLLSIALADKINILKKENEEKGSQIIQHLKEKEIHLRAAKESELILEKLKKETLASQLESLKTQMNPHFLFNSLNILTELIQQNQNKAVKFVEELSDVYRYVLESRNKEVVDMREELKFIEAFIYLLKIRFSDKISININLEKTEGMVIPPLALQLLIENAIKHNVISKEKPLFISIDQEDEYLIIKNKIHQRSEITRPSGIGLKNIQSRYSFLTDKKVFVSNDSKFFAVRIPMLKLSKE